MYRRTLPVAALALASLVAIAPTCNNQPQSQFSVDRLIPVDQARLSRTNFRYSYRVQLSNSGGSVSDVQAVLSTTSPHTSIVDGNVAFGDVASGAVVQSSDTVSIVQDRSMPFDPDALQWMFSAGQTRPDCETLNLTQSEVDDAVADAVSRLVQQGLQVSSGSFAHPVEFELVLNEVLGDLGCALGEDGSAGLAPGSPSPQSFGVASAFSQPYVSSVDYCGPGYAVDADANLFLGFSPVGVGPVGVGLDIDYRSTGRDGTNPHVSDCLNRVCYRHDECYRSNCIRGICSFSVAAEAAQCDIKFFVGLSQCAVSTVLGFRDLFVSAFALALASSPNPASCDSNASRCAVGSCALEECDGIDNDCNCPGDTNGDGISCGPGDQGVDDVLNITGRWQGSWSSSAFADAGSIDATLNQAGNIVIGDFSLTGSNYVSGGRLQGDLTCQDVGITGAVGTLFGVAVLNGTFDGTMTEIDGSGLYQVTVDAQGNPRVDDGDWSLYR